MRKIILIIAMCLAMVVICWAGDKLFFEGWTIKTAHFTPQGLIQAVMVNPDTTSGIKSVVVQVNPANEKIIAYYYFDEQELPKLFVLDRDGQYQPKPTESCSQCHFKAI